MSERNRGDKRRGGEGRGRKECMRRYREERVIRE